jgi:hypothetical protein
MDNDPHPHERLTRPLDPTGSRLRELLARAVDYVANTVDRLPESPASDFRDIHQMLADPQIRAAPPRDGRPLAELLDVLDDAASKGMNLPSPGFMAFTPGGGLVTAAIADLIADVLNRPTGVAFPAPALVALETNVLRWTADLFGMPDSTMGTLTTGASIATLSAVITARHARLAGDFRRGTAYVSDQAHPCIAKALRLAGFPRDAVRTVPSDADQRMDVRALEMAVDADRAVGLHPFLVVGTAGTTNTGPSTRSQGLPMSRSASGCGFTSTPRTAATFNSPSAAGTACTAPTAPTHWSSIPTRASSYRSEPVACWCARENCSAAPTAPTQQPIGRTCETQGWLTSLTTASN